MTNLIVQDQTFYFDLEDYDKIKDFCWNLHKSRSVFYVEARDNNSENKKVIKMHRIIMKAGSKDIIDHINRFGYDNRKENLRITNHTNNFHNRGECERNSSGRNGVSFRKDTNKYRARITVNRNQISVGEFYSFEEAVDARKMAEGKYYGEFARKD